jgi:uncharacterized membrane protein
MNNRFQHGFSTATVIIRYGIVLLLALALIYMAPRWLFALLLVLILPGFTLTAVLFPRHKLDLPEHMLLVVSSSIAICVAGGFLLYKLEWGFQTEMWLLLLLGFSLLAAIGAWLRNGRPMAVRRPDWTAAVGFTLNQTLLLGMAFVIVAMAIAVARVPAASAGLQGYTQLWISPCPTTDSKALLGIGSNEFAATTYRLEIQQAEQILAEWPAITLQPKEETTLIIDLPRLRVYGQPIEALLYKTETPETVYRRVALRKRHWSAAEQTGNGQTGESNGSTYSTCE